MPAAAYSCWTYPTGFKTGGVDEAMNTPFPPVSSFDRSAAGPFGRDAALAEGPVGAVGAVGAGDCPVGTAALLALLEEQPASVSATTRAMAKHVGKPARRTFKAGRASGRSHPGSCCARPATASPSCPRPSRAGSGRGRSGAGSRSRTGCCPRRPHSIRSGSLLRLFSNQNVA